MTIVLQVRILNGQQSVSYNVTHTGPMMDTQDPEATGLGHDDYHHLLQISSLSATTRSLLLGAVSILRGVSDYTPEFSSSVISAAFFDTSLHSGTDFTWGNVSGGIEQLSHNVSAAILTMDLGEQDSTCIVSTQDIMYEYSWRNLWLPYGVGTVSYIFAP